MSDESKERQLVEEYMQEYCLEAVIDEVVNGVLEARPSNPYIEMSKLMEAKSTPEILHVRLGAAVVDAGAAVRAAVSTTVGVFEACCGVPSEQPDAEEDFRDYSAIQEEVSSSLLGKNPTEFQRIDDIIQRIEGLDQSVALALSMACARAGARHKGMELYHYLAECGKTTPAMPVPCISVVSRAAGPADRWNTHSQDVGVIPTTSSSFAEALEAVTKAYRTVGRIVADSKAPVLPSSSTGCPKLRSSLADILKIAHEATSVEGAAGGLKLVVDMRGCDLAAVPAAAAAAEGEGEVAAPPAPAASAAAVKYQVGGEAPVVEKAPEKKAPAKGKAAAEVAPASPRPAETYAVSGAEFVDTFVSSWADYEMVSVEDPGLGSDLDTLRCLKTVSLGLCLCLCLFLFVFLFVFLFLFLSHKALNCSHKDPTVDNFMLYMFASSGYQKTADTLNSVKSSGGSKFEYALSGVGEDARCNLQVVADAALASAEELKAMSKEAVFNSVKVRPLRYRTVSEAIALCAAVRQLGWALIIGSEESAAETTDSFISDLAVAVGAGQFSCGGLGSGVFTAKLDRLLQISETDDSVLFVGRKFRC
jgi:enolase